MSFDRFHFRWPSRLRIPIPVQVGVVAALFVSALIVLWTTGASVVARERRRSEAKGLLEEIGNELAIRGRDIIAGAGEFPNFPEERSRDEVDRADDPGRCALAAS